MNELLFLTLIKINKYYENKNKKIKKKSINYENNRANDYLKKN